MIRSLETLRAVDSSSKLAVAVAQDAEVLLAVDAARKLGIATAILVGDEPEIRAIAAKLDICLDSYAIVHEADKVEACRKAVKLVRDKEADVVMKGLVDTSIILKAVLDKEIGLRQSPVLSHVAVFEVPGYDRLFYLTDAAMNIAPDAETKKHILNNAVKVASCRPHGNVAVLKLEGVDTVEQAQKLRNTVLYMKRSDVNLPDGKWFVSELIGCQVLDADDESVCYGELKDVESYPANDIWYVKTPDGEEVLVPAIKDVVVKCDVADNKAYIRPLRGLFDED